MRDELAAVAHRGGDRQLCGGALVPASSSFGHARDLMKPIATAQERKMVAALGKILVLAESICPEDENDPLHMEIVGIEARAQDAIETIQSDIRLRRMKLGFSSLLASFGLPESGR